MKAIHLAVVLSLLTSARAATVRVELVRGAHKQPVELQLGLVHDEEPPHWIARRMLAAAEHSAEFSNLDGGVYVVLASGPTPLERMTAKTVVGASDERVVRLTILERRATGRVTHGGKPLGKANVRLRHDAWHWSTELVTAADGTFDGALWEGGDFDVAIHGGGLPSTVRTKVTLANEARTAFAIDVPARTIRGRVVDGNGAAVPRVIVLLRAAGNVSVPSNVRMTTDESGVFAFTGLPVGPHTIEVLSDRHLISHAVAVDLHAGDALLERTVVLDSGRVRELRIVDSERNPVARALVACTTGAELRAMAYSDDQGRVLLATPAGEPSVAWIAPPGGSFAVARFRGDSPSPATVVVPRASAALDVRTLTTANDALPSVKLLMRYNGDIVPPDVAKLLRKENVSLLTGADGRALLARIPVGIYEFWPYASDEEVEALIASASLIPAPINVNVVTGENRVTVRFERFH